MHDLVERAVAAAQSGEAIRRARDFVLGHALHRLPEGWRKQLYHGKRYHCPLCQSDTRSFLALYRDFFAFCPICWSLQRHRLVWLFLQQRGLLTAHSPLRLLHVAPEPALEAQFRALRGVRYLSIDLFNPHAMETMDVCDIRREDGAFDAIYCSHVLEHVPDDRKAMREFWRVLAPGGWALILVPITGRTTDEDPSVTHPAERQRRFGQHDHVRVYGTDVIDRLRAASLEVESCTTEGIASALEIERFGLARGEILLLCRR